MKRVTTEYGTFDYFPLDCIGGTIATGKFWDECLRPYMDVLQAGDVYVDVGANLGFFPIYLASRGVVCHAFEPAPALYELLVSNISLNNQSVLCHLYKTALYDRETTLVLHSNWKALTAYDEQMDYEKASNSGLLCLVEQGRGDECRKFEAKTLDSFKIEDVKLLKIDTQGCDLRILHGAHGTIETYRPVVLFEYEEVVSVAHDDDFDKYAAFFRGIGYNIKRLGDVEWAGEPQ